MTAAFPKRGPDAGTMDQVRSHCAAWHQTTLTADWPTCPLQTPSGGGLAPTPDRSKTPAKGCSQLEEGLTNQGPLQKPGFRVRAKEDARPGMTIPAYKIPSASRKLSINEARSR